jgi:hypothetical protein
LRNRVARRLSNRAAAMPPRESNMDNGPEAFRASSLLARFEILIEEGRFLFAVSYRRRLEVVLELCEIRRELESLGYRV